MGIYMKMKKLLLTISFIAFSLNSGSATAASNTASTTSTVAATNTAAVNPKKVVLEIADVWARASMPPNRNSVAYMTINNKTDKEYVMIGASSQDVANNVELHKSFVDEKGVSRMSSIDKIVIPAKSTVTMDPGGIHIMLLDLKNNLKAGDRINIDLKFEGMDPLTVQAEVK
jgi:hypothetical protein